MPHTAWQVTLTDAGELQWTEEVDGARIVHDDEPGAGFGAAGAAVIGLLPIDWLL